MAGASGPKTCRIGLAFNFTLPLRVKDMPPLRNVHAVKVSESDE